MRSWTMLLLAVTASAAAADAPLRLPNGEPLVCIYYFPHWWEPWKSDDDAIRQDLKRLRKMGFNTLLLDHEWSQAIDGNWRWLDRAHRLAKEADLKIVPWLSLKTWCDIGAGNRPALFKEWYGTNVRLGEDQEGKPTAPVIWHEELIRGGAAYALEYLKRYRDQALLHLAWEGKTRPVLSLSVESAWVGSFDDASNARFRDWVRKQYETVGAVNDAWGTRLANYDAINPRDKSVFDYAAHPKGEAKHPKAVEDHVEFRSQTISDSLAQMGKQVRAKHPDVLLWAEIPYQYGSKHPHAVGYRIGYGANPGSCDYAEIVQFRCTGPLDGAEAAVLREHQRRTGQKFVLTYRTYSDWALPPDSPKVEEASKLYAGQTADLSSGFGFYSWNEMVDVHVAYSPKVGPADWTPEKAERAAGLLAEMVRRYRSLTSK
jgi:hypothetical protein